MGSQVQGSEGPRGQIDVRGHHLPNGGRVLEAIGRERIELVTVRRTPSGGITHAAVLV